MKKINLLILVFLTAIFSLNAQDVPVPSPYAEVMQRVGLTDVTIEYSRPGVKDRKIFGGLEAFGEVWRTGANAATKITFSTAVNFGGVDLEAGTYSIMSIPGEKEWKVMLNSDTRVTEGSYKEENNVAVVSVKSMHNKTTETMQFTFQNVKDESADLVFKWEAVMWMIPIKVQAKEMAIENIKKKINEIEGAYGVYNSSARYYLNADMDAKQALEWAKKSVEIESKFWNTYTLSLCYEAVGDKEMAIEIAKKSLQLSEEAEYKPYIKMNKENIEKWSK